MPDYYVSTGGSDAGGVTGGIGTPWASLSHACSLVSGVGDVINVAAGAYTDNAQATLAVGVKISGASAATTTISTTANPYILATTAVPVVDGSNEISGLGITGSGSNVIINSHGRSNQKIHDCAFTNGNVLVEGVTPRYINPADGSETGDAISAAPNESFSVEPFSTSWAENCEIYSNTATNVNIKCNTIKNGLIHHNTVDNSGGAKSAFGNTGYFWSGVDFYNNEHHISSNDHTNIGLEIWHLSADCKFYDNIFDGWVSLILNTSSDNTPWSMEIYDNDFTTGGSTTINNALEIGFYGMRNVRVSGNYFNNTDATNMSFLALRASGIIGPIWIYNNIIYGTGGPGMIFQANTAGPGAVNPGNIDDVYIYNNVFDTMEAGGSAGIRVEADNVRGDIDGIYIRNNIFMNLTYPVVFTDATHTSSGNFYDHNLRTAGTSGTINAAGLASFTVGTGNITGNPDILATGDRWTNWYKPTPEGNLIDAGVDVTFAYTGTAPDIGAFEEPPVVAGLIATHRIGWRLA